MLSPSESSKVSVRDQSAEHESNGKASDGRNKEDVSHGEAKQFLSFCVIMAELIFPPSLRRYPPRTPDASSLAMYHASAAESFLDAVE